MEPKRFRGSFTSAATVLRGASSVMLDDLDGDEEATQPAAAASADGEGTQPMANAAGLPDAAFVERTLSLRLVAVGLKFHNIAAARALMHAGASLELRREPANHVDSLAVRVVAHAVSQHASRRASHGVDENLEVDIGYLKWNQAASLSPCLDSGCAEILSAAAAASEDSGSSTDKGGETADAVDESPDPEADAEPLEIDAEPAAPARVLGSSALVLRAECVVRSEAAAEALSYLVAAADGHGRRVISVPAGGVSETRAESDLELSRLSGLRSWPPERSGLSALSLGWQPLPAPAEQQAEQREAAQEAAREARRAQALPPPLAPAPAPSWAAYDPQAVGPVSRSEADAAARRGWPPADGTLARLGLGPADDAEWWGRHRMLPPSAWQVKGAVDMLPLSRQPQRSNVASAAAMLDGQIHALWPWTAEMLAELGAAMRGDRFWCARKGDAFIRGFGGPYVLGQKPGDFKVINGAEHTPLSSALCVGHTMMYTAIHLKPPPAPFNTIVFGLNLRGGGFHYHQDADMGYKHGPRESAPKNAPLVRRQPVVTTVFYERPEDSGKARDATRERGKGGGGEGAAHGATGKPIRRPPSASGGRALEADGQLALRVWGALLRRGRARHVRRPARASDLARCRARPAGGPAAAGGAWRIPLSGVCRAHRLARRDHGAGHAPGCGGPDARVSRGGRVLQAYRASGRVESGGRHGRPRRVAMSWRPEAEPGAQLPLAYVLRTTPRTGVQEEEGSARRLHGST